MRHRLAGRAFPPFRFCMVARPSAAWHRGDRGESRSPTAWAAAQVPCSH